MSVELKQNRGQSKSAQNGFDRLTADLRERSAPVDAVPEKVEVYTSNFDEQSWESIKAAIHEIELSAFPRDQDEECVIDLEQRRAELTSPNAIVHLLHAAHDDRVIGYALAYASNHFALDSDTAHLERTILHGDFQGKGLVWPLREQMHHTLKRMGFDYVSSLVTNAPYARALSERYGDRLIEDAYLDAIEFGYTDVDLQHSSFQFTLKL